MTQNEPTLELERLMKAPAERIYNAFLDPKLLEQYYAPPGTESIYHAFNAEVGGKGHYEFRGPDGAMAFRIEFLELEPYTTIRHKYAMDAPGPMGEGMELLITLEETDEGTLVRFQQWGLPEPIPREGALAGWKGMIERLAAFVEAA